MISCKITLLKRAYYLKEQPKVECVTPLLDTTVGAVRVNHNLICAALHG